MFDGRLANSRSLAMHLLPPRRWFQFRLSTWFVLVAILGWAMACWPFYWHEITHYSAPMRARDERTALGVFVGRSNSADYTDWIHKQREAFLTHGFPASSFPRTSYVEGRDIVNPATRWPVLALAAFLAWKAAWAVVERRRRKSGAPE
jgi:hypothetical protein